MTILLVLVILYAIFIGFYGVNKLNKFLTQVEPRSDYYQKPQLDKEAAEVLILGKADEVSPLVAKLSEDHIHYTIIESEDRVSYSEDYRAVFAISHDDLSNLTLCIIMKKLLSVETVFALCNNVENESLYKKNGIFFSHNTDHWEDAFYKKFNLQIPAHR